jgi:two-component system sensor histidine kinase MprB
VSLRRRITLAATVAVAAVAVLIGVASYLTTRAHLYSDVRQQLLARAEPALQPHGGDFDHGGGGGGGPAPGPGGGVPIGGAPGYFQNVYPDGTVTANNGGTPALPVDSRVKAIARSAQGSFYRDATVQGTHVEVLTIGDPYDQKAVEVALPLTSADTVLHGLLLTDGILVGLAVLLAVGAGTLVGRGALAPIDRFVEQTEEVTRTVDHSRRLEEEGAEELRRLAISFNDTLDALERSLMAQRHLIADASHELRTPLAALRSNIQVFLEAERLPVDERVALQESILLELDELTQLVTDVLELARGSVRSEHDEQIELDGVVREAIARTERRAPQLHFDADLEPTVIVNAQHRITRAVTNVIDNARKWSPDDGHVEVSLRDGVLRVRDHGPGFKPQDIDHVFDRFYRAEEARRMPGSGLGLAIVKQAAEERGGWVRAANAEGGGALLEVSFGSGRS